MKVVALAGGVGGAKLADGLRRILPAEDLTVIVNTGDDFIHLGMHISPDLDTVCYTLAGIANPVTGWGRANESWGALESLAELGGPTWFRLGDHDLGLHLERTRRLQAGESLTSITAAICLAWGIAVQVLPMSDEFVPTSVYTIEEGELPFQEYFVRQQCRPRVVGFRFNQVEHAHPALGVAKVLEQTDLVVICPSNPWVSIDPILAIPGIRQMIESQRVVAVSPIIGGQAVKGPAAKMYSELGLEPSALSVARHYGMLLTGFVLDQVDREQANAVSALGIQTLVVDTLMVTPEDRQRLAAEVVQFGEELEKSPIKKEIHVEDKRASPSFTNERNPPA